MTERRRVESQDPNRYGDMSKHVNTTGSGIGKTIGFGAVAILLGLGAWLAKDTLFPQHPESGQAHNADSAQAGGQ